MDNKQLQEILKNHALWVKTDGKEGKRANLSGTNLSGADFSGANFFGANFFGANLSRANLSRANLSRANLSRANLSGANLSGADFSGADFSGADLDYSCWPLSCKSLQAQVDKRIGVQLLYHAISVLQNVEDTECQNVANNEEVLKLVNQFHREDCPRLAKRS